MTPMAPIPRNSPVIKAWEEYKLTDDYSNTRKWAMNPEHVDGSLWAAFYNGYESGKITPVTDYEILTGPFHTPNVSLPPIGEGPRRKMLIEIEVTEDFEKRLDNQWMVEREIHADRWNWKWLEKQPSNVSKPIDMDKVNEFARFTLNGPDKSNL